MRSRSAAYKVAELEQADPCSSCCAIGAPLRRGGLCSPHRTVWRREHEVAALAHARASACAESQVIRGAAAVAPHAENDRLERELDQAHTDHRSTKTLHAAGTSAGGVIREQRQRILSAVAELVPAMARGERCVRWMLGYAT